MTNRFSKLFTIGQNSKSSSANFNAEMDNIYTGLNTLDADKTDLAGTGRTTETVMNVKSSVDNHKSASVLDHPDASVTTSKLADRSVTTNKIADSSVYGNHLADGSITANKLMTGLTQSLDTNAEFAQRGVSVKWPNGGTTGAKGDGVADDTSAIQAALDAAADNGIVLFPPGRYKTKQLTINKDGLTIYGYGATIVSDVPTIASPTTDGTLLANSTVMVNKVTKKDTLTPTVDIVAGDSTITLPNVINVAVDDMILVSTTKMNPFPGNNKYTMGAYKYVKSVDSVNNKITLNAPLETSLAVVADVVKVNVYKPMKNFRMFGLRFELIKDGRQMAVSLANCKNPIIRDCKFIGGGESYLGLGVQGFNVEIDNVYCEEFLDTGQLAYGYGVAVAGHDVKVTNSTFIRCKHGISGGDDRYVNTGFLYEGNYGYDPQLCAFDAHGSVINVKMLNNTVDGVGKSYGASGLWARGKNTEIRGNTIKASPVVVAGSISAIKMIEDATQNISITDNQVDGAAFTYGIKCDEQAGGVVSDLTVSQNKIRSYNAIFVKGTTNIVIAHNDIVADAMGVQLVAGNRVSIDGNLIDYGGTAYGMGINLGAVTGTTYKAINMRGNIIKRSSANGSNPIRVYDGWDDLVITNNNIDGAGAAINIKVDEDTKLTNIIQRDNLYDEYLTSLPTAASYYRGRTVTVKGATGVADGIYQCVKLRDDTYAWTQLNAMKEQYISLWTSDSTFAGKSSTGAIAAGSFFLQKGTTQYGSAYTASSAKLITLSPSWPTTQNFAFESAFCGTTAGQTVGVTLWDMTTNTAVASSYVSTTATEAVVIRSGQFTLTPGHLYGVTPSTSSSVQINIVDASLVAING